MRIAMPLGQWVQTSQKGSSAPLFSVPCVGKVFVDRVVFGTQFAMIGTMFSPTLETLIMRAIMRSFEPRIRPAVSAMVTFVRLRFQHIAGKRATVSEVRILPRPPLAQVWRSFFL